MRMIITGFAGFTLLGIGYFLGTSGALSPTTLMAQAADGEAPAKAKKGAKPKGEPEVKQEGPQLSDETQAKIKAAADALNAAMEALKQEQLYNSATKGLNTFAILSGRVDSLKDLESGRGVDPETFAALYADLAIDEVAEKIARDPENRLTYNGKVIRMYPISRLRSLYANRATFTGEEIARSPDAKPEKGKAKKKTPDAADGANQ